MPFFPKTDVKCRRKFISVYTDIMKSSSALIWYPVIISILVLTRIKTRFSKCCRSNKNGVTFYNHVYTWKSLIIELGYDKLLASVNGKCLNKTICTFWDVLLMTTPIYLKKLVNVVKT